MAIRDGRSYPVNYLNFINAVEAFRREQSVSFGMAVNSLLAVGALASQGQIEVIRSINSAPMPVSLFLLTVGNSGTGKTRMEGAVLQTAKEFEISQEANDNHNWQNYEVESEIWTKTKKQLDKLISKALFEGTPTDHLNTRLRTLFGQRPSPPRRSRLIHQDTTIPALIQAYTSNWTSAALFDSDAAHLFTSGKFMPHLTTLTKMWDGSRILTDRISRQSFSVNNPRLTISLGLQSKPFYKFLSQGDGIAIASGFMARALIHIEKYLPSTFEVAKFKETNIFNKRIHELLEKQLNHFKNDKKPAIFFPSCEAQNLIDNYRASINTNKDIQMRCFTGFSARIADNCLRIAAIIQHIESDQTEISSASMRFAITICEQFTANAIQACDDRESQSSEELAFLLLNWINIKKKEGKLMATPGFYCLHRNTILQYAPARLRKSESLENALRFLTEKSNVIITTGTDKKSWVNFPTYLVDAPQQTP